MVSFYFTYSPSALDRTVDTLLQADFHNSAVQYMEEYLPNAQGILLAHKPAYLAKTRIKPDSAFTLLPYIRHPFSVPLTPKAQGRTLSALTTTAILLLSSIRKGRGKMGAQEKDPKELK